MARRTIPALTVVLPLALVVLPAPLAMSIALAAPAPATSTATATATETEVRKVLDDQVAAWNRRDLEGYMAGYWNSPELRFFGGDKVTGGWKETLDRYRGKYQGAGREMGALVMSDVEVKPLSRTHAFVRGRWRLRFEGGKEAAGLFTLLVERRPEGWRIVHDHSS